MRVCVWNLAGVHAVHRADHLARGQEFWARLCHHARVGDLVHADSDYSDCLNAADSAEPKAKLVVFSFGACVCVCVCVCVFDFLVSNFTRRHAQTRSSTATPAQHMRPQHTGGRCLPKISRCCFLQASILLQHSGAFKIRSDDGFSAELTPNCLQLIHVSILFLQIVMCQLCFCMFGLNLWCVSLICCNLCLHYLYSYLF